MARIGAAVKLCNMRVVWDGITRPEPKTDKRTGTPFTEFSMKVAGHPQAVEVAELNALVQETLNSSEFKGVMPHNGKHPVQMCDPTIAEGALAGLVSINPKTRKGDIRSKVFDTNGQPMDPTVYGPMMYPGCIVNVLVTAYPFNNESKGVALSLEGFQIVDATAPRLAIGGGMTSGEVAGVFGGAPAGAPAGAPGAAPAYTPPPVPAPAAYTPPAPAAYTPPAPAAYTPPAVPGAVAPAPDFLNPAAVPAPPAYAPAPPAPVGPVMLPKAAGVTYDAFRAQGWTDEQLRAQGYMQ